MKTGNLTARQEIFAQHYALTGRAERSAIAAGTNPASARTRSYLWLKKAEIRERIRKIQAKEFRGLKQEVALEAAQLVCESLVAPRGSYRKGVRALRLLERLGMLQPNSSMGQG